MGIIQKQAISNTVVSVIGIGIGSISQLLMPFILSTNEIGTLAIINSVSTVIATVFSLGFTQIALRSFSKFKDENNSHSGFLIFGLIVSLIGICLGEFIFYLFHDLFIGENEKNKLVQSFSYLIIPIIIFKTIFKNMDIYLRMLLNSVTGAFLESIVMKLIILLGLLCFLLNFLDFDQVALIYMIALSLPGFLILIISFIKTGKIIFPDKRKFTQKNRIKMMNYGLYGILASASTIIIISVDQVMLNNMVNTDAVGIYSVLFFAGMLVSIPARGIKRISVPILADAWNRNDNENIKEVYNKSVITMTIFGFYLFIVGWACIHPALTFLDKYADFVYVFFFIGLAQLLDMMTGVNMEIIATSSKYKINTYFNFILAMLVIFFNYLFIQEWELVGAASASSLAMFLVNLFRWNYLRKHFKLQPFNKEFFKVVLIGVVFLLLVSYIEINLNPFLLIITYGISITVLYWGIILNLNLSQDINKWILKLKHRFMG